MMRKSRSLAPFALLALLSLPALPLAADTFVVDRSHSDVSFVVRHFVSNVRGQFRDFEGTFELNPAKPEASSAEFSVKVASLDTGNEGRDKHLKSPDFFDAEKHPLITFKSTSVKATGKDAYDVTGAFTMRGVTKTVTLSVKFMGIMKAFGGKEKAGLEATVTLNRQDYGVSWNRTLDTGGVVLGDDVKVTVALELDKKQPPPPAPAAGAAAPATKS